MDPRQPPGIVFTGDRGIGVGDFLKRMEQWFIMMGDGYDGKTVQSKQMRVAHIHLACPALSVVWRFVQTLSEEIRSDENALAKALIKQFQDDEMDDIDLLSMMCALRQGKRDVFLYSLRFLKLLRRMSSGLLHYDKVIIRYYVDGLASRRLREMAFVSFLRPDSRAPPNQVIKDVLLYATQLKVKGYRKYSSGNSDDDDDDGDSDDSDDDDDLAFDGYNSGSDSESEDNYSSASRKRRKKKSAKSKKTSAKREKQSKWMGRKSSKRQEDEGSVRRDAREQHTILREPEGYIQADGYDNYPQPLDYPSPDKRQNAGQFSTTRRHKYSNGRSLTLYNSGHLKTGRICLPACSDVCEPTRQRPSDLHSTKEPSIRLRCSKLYNPVLTATLLGPEHPDTPIALREKPQGLTPSKPVKMIEAAVDMSALEKLQGWKPEAITAPMMPFNPDGFVCNMAEEDRKSVV